jgi:Skp family chaperone for outer membrane proteins
MFKWFFLWILFVTKIQAAHAGETITVAIEEAERAFKAAELKMAQEIQSGLESKVVQAHQELQEAAYACEAAAEKYVDAYKEKRHAEEKVRELSTESLDPEGLKGFKVFLEGIVKAKEREMLAVLEEAESAGELRTVAREKMVRAQDAIRAFKDKWGKLLHDPRMDGLLDSRVGGMLGLSVPTGYSPPAQRSSWNPDRVTVKLPVEFQACGLAEVTK